MASTATSTVTTPPAEPTESVPFLVRLEKHRKVISYVVGGIAAVVIVGWLYTETGRRKTSAAADALDAARGTLETGNLPAAATEFQAVIQRFGGTDAAFQAELGLNTVRLASGQAQLAVDELKKFAERNPPPHYQSGAWLIAGGALENLAKFDDAAAAYLKAADIAPEDYRKVEALLGAGRSYRQAGKDQQAIDVYRRIVGKFAEDLPGVPEAKVRLAELTKGAG